VSNHVARRGTQEVVLHLGVGGFHHDHIDFPFFRQFYDLTMYCPLSNDSFKIYSLWGMVSV
jgi:hypothetical protein